MKKIASKLWTLAVAAMVSLSFAACSAQPAGPKTLVVAQGKVEIDKALKAYAAEWGKANNVTVTIKTVGGGGNDLQTELKTAYAANDMPDIMTVAGPDDVKQWTTLLADLTGEPWTKNTALAYREAGKVIGFPVAVEGWGMAYNADILKKAGVDPATLTNLAAYKDAFAKIDAKKAELGLNSVVSMASSIEMFWVVAHHNVNSYLSNGLPYGDLSVAQMALDGKLDTKRFAEYADWVELLFKYSDKTILTAGNYDAQVGAFATQKAAFLHQGNWVDPNLKTANATFAMGFAPHGSSSAVTDGIFVSAPSWYVVNKNSKSVDLAKKFLSDMALTEAGAKFMVTDAGMIPAFSNIKLQPDGALSKSVQDWSNKGKVYSWNQYLLPNDFRNDVLAPIYNQFAMGKIDKTKFIELFTAAVASLKK